MSWILVVVLTFKCIYLNSTFLIEKYHGIIFKEDFENKTPFEFAHKQFPEEHSFTNVSYPKYAGSFSGKFELRYGDRRATKSGRRSEVLFPRQTNNERWYSFAVFFPSEDFQFDEDSEIITQWHQGNLGTPSSCIRIINDRLIFRVGNVQPKGNAKLLEHYELGRLPKDRWIEFVFHFVHSFGNDGITEVWMDGEKVVDRKGGNMYNGELPRWKIGIYKSTWDKKSTLVSKRILFFDNVKMGNEITNFEEMDPKK